MNTKVIFSAALIVLITFLAISFAAAQKLRDIHIQKQVLIEGSLEEVYEQVVYLKNFPSWSPFKEADPSQKTEVKGTDGAVGAEFHWVGNEGKDIGFQTIKEIKPKQYVKMGCDIKKPFEAKPVFEYRFEQVGDKVRVIQDFY